MHYLKLDNADFNLPSLTIYADFLQQKKRKKKTKPQPCFVIILI